MPACTARSIRTDMLGQKLLKLWQRDQCSRPRGEVKMKERYVLAALCMLGLASCDKEGTTPSADQGVPQNRGTGEHRR